MRPLDHPMAQDELDEADRLIECPDCEEPWPPADPACPSCGLTIKEVAERLASENPRYDSGNPDWERDFERTR